MTREISKAESWEQVYEAFQQINFTAFDYDTVKASLVEYTKIYHPESFNDYIESSEYIIIIEAFAYIAELLSYRIDMNAHENFITTAQRKQSILRLATMLSYNPSRNIPARALVKMTSVTTTEVVYDSRGTNLANVRIIWNDSNNPDWKEQFFLVMNKVLQQNFGTVAPSDRVQVDDVLFELYALRNTPMANGISSYSINASGSSYPMELVPVALDGDGPYERRPGLSDSFSILYGSDGLGDSSDTTGFFIFTKQGSLSKVTDSFNGITPNQTFDIEKDNINDTDLWVNQINPDTGAILDELNTDAIGRLVGNQGQWTQISKQGIENVIFNTDLNRNKYQVESLENDQVRIVFGDGEFADIPNGTFDMWTRVSANETVTIPRSSIVGVVGGMTYVDSINVTQTFSYTFSAINTITNSSPSEDLERIRRTAPLVYYTQARMVNGPDYNSYPLQDPSILKLRAINRTFSGDSKYLAWHDPSEYYEDVRIFGNDLLMYFREDLGIMIPVTVGVDVEIVIKTFIQPYLTHADVLTYHAVHELGEPERRFSTSEVVAIENAFNLAFANISLPLSLVFEGGTWVPYSASDVGGKTVTFTISADPTQQFWTVQYNGIRTITESPTTEFWHHNDYVRTVSERTSSSNFDTVVLLQANVDGERTGILSDDLITNVLGGVVANTSPSVGLPEINQLYVAPPDSNDNGVPNVDAFGELLNRTDIEPVAAFNTDIVIGTDGDNAFDYIIGADMLVVKATNSLGEVVTLEQDVDYVEYTTAGVPKARGFVAQELAADTPADSVSNVIQLRNTANTVDAQTVEFTRLDFVYFESIPGSTTNAFSYVGSENANIIDWLLDAGYQGLGEGTHLRYRGRDSLNFAWFHITPREQLVDPSTTNINDMIIITRGYYQATLDWINGVSEKPTVPTSLSLRSDYSDLLDARLISDTVVMHSGRFKILFGEHADPELRATITVVRASNPSKTDNEIKNTIVDVVTSFFDIDLWEFGETFNFTELASQIHAALVNEVSSVVLVPTYSSQLFGDLMQIVPQEDEIFIPSISVNDVEVVDFLNPQNIRQSQ